MPDPRPAWQVQLPNTLTAARLVLAGVFVVVLSLVRLGERRPETVLLLVGAGLFVLAAVTDALDGHLARRWGVVSVFGRVMDPVADKVLVLGALILLAGPGFSVGGDQRSGVQAWMAIVVLGRELIVTSLRSLAEASGQSFAATWSGKWKMILQCVVIPLVLVVLAFTGAERGTGARWVVDASVWAMVLVTVWSGVPYVRRARSML